MAARVICILVFLAGTLETGLSDECFHAGECRDSQTVGAATLTDEYACLDLCRADPGCSWFTFSPSINLCVLFEDCRTLDGELCPDCLSGHRSCVPDEPTCSIQGQCSGVLDHFEELPTADECLLLCQSTFGCRWITFVKGSSGCLLYKTCPELDGSCEGCLSSERRCSVEETTTTTTEASTTSPPKALTKLAVLTGLEGSGAYDTKVFVIDLEDPSKVCKNLPDTPVSIKGAGTLFDGSMPMFCGGVGVPGYRCACFGYRQSTWIALPQNSSCRALSGFASIVAGEDQTPRFVLSGGWNGTSSVSQVDAFDGTSWQTLSNLPSPVNSHCMVAINDTALLTIGGETPEGFTSETNVFNSETNTWSPGPDLNMRRRDFTCATVTWNNLGQPETTVVVAGGVDPGSLFSVELLDLNNLSSGWQFGPELPGAVLDSAMVQYKDSVILVGGRGQGDGRRLYQLSSRDGPWIEMEQVLPNARSHHIAFLIPDGLTDCQ